MRAHKYGAKPTTIDGIRFASKKEAKRFGELKLLLLAGEIRELQLQPEFPLQVPALHRMSYPNGELVLAGVGCYRADFSYEERTGRTWQSVVEDVKGMKTPVYRLKKKMVEAAYGIAIRET